VFLEAMACGLPVVTTDVGGNSEVVESPTLGLLVPFGDSHALVRGLIDALSRDWDREAIREWAVDNSWDHRIAVLVRELRAVTGDRALAGGG
jgi:glycosyltransferase involved in cell wall biosynthesis